MKFHHLILVLGVGAIANAHAQSADFDAACSNSAIQWQQVTLTPKGGEAIHRNQLSIRHAKFDSMEAAQATCLLLANYGNDASFIPSPDEYQFLKRTHDELTDVFKSRATDMLFMNEAVLKELGKVKVQDPQATIEVFLSNYENAYAGKSVEVVYPSTSTWEIFWGRDRRTEKAPVNSH